MLFGKSQRACFCGQQLGFGGFQALQQQLQTCAKRIMGISIRTQAAIGCFGTIATI